MSGVRPPLAWVEITPDYRCNNRCLGCFSVSDAGPSMTAREIMSALVDGRRAGARSLWIGGGEPSIRQDLVPIVREATKLGYDRIRLQTNAMMLAHEPLVARLASAGLTEVSLSIKGADAASHDAYANTPGTFDLMMRGAENAHRHGLALEGDILVYASNVHALVAIVSTFHAARVARFRVWLFSAAASTDATLKSEVPRIADVVVQLRAAMDLGLSTDPEFLVSLHTPPCTLPATHRHARFDPTAYALRVVNPGGHSFLLDESPMEGGHYLESCEACSYRSRCGGIRGEYVSLYGSGEFVPIAHSSECHGAP